MNLSLTTSRLPSAGRRLTRQALLLGTVLAFSLLVIFVQVLQTAMVRGQQARDELRAAGVQRAAAAAPRLAHMEKKK